MTTETVWCPRCEAAVDRRRLVAVEAGCCPRCRMVIAERERFSIGRPEAQTFEDLAAVGAWLDAEAAGGHLEVRPDRELEGVGHYRWALTGDALGRLPPGALVEVLYHDRFPGTVAVWVHVTEDGERDHDPALAAACLAHGVQPRTAVLGGSGIATRTVWGVVQHLGTEALLPGLLRAVVARLAAAVWDAAADPRLLLE